MRKKTSNGRFAALRWGEVLRRFKERHGSYYDYSQAVYAGINKKIKIICPKHGAFFCTPQTHMRGGECPECKAERIKRKSLHRFIRNSRAAHGDKYDYSKIVWVNGKTKVEIVCPKHGSFWQKPEAHEAGHGCKRCAAEKVSLKKRVPFDEFVKKANSIHNSRYKYDVDSYYAVGDKVNIFCPEHGWFEQNIDAHLSGRGCWHCGVKKRADSQRFSPDEIITMLTNVLDGITVCEETVVDFVIPAKFICDKHGAFRRRPADVLNKGQTECPFCKAPDGFEREVGEYIERLGLVCERNKRGLLGYPCTDRHEVDLYIPSVRVGIECHGAIWHSTKFNRSTVAHKNKAMAARNAGIRLIQIFDVDWFSSRQRILKGLIRVAVGRGKRLFGARHYKCFVQDNVKAGKAKDFLRRHHLYGCRGSLYAWLETRSGKVVAAMSFLKTPDGWEVGRFAVYSGCIIPGAFSRLFSALRGATSAKRVTFFVDRMLFSGGALPHAGFKHVGEVPPRYRYFAGGSWAGDRRTFQRKNLPRILGDKFDPALSEQENLARMGYYRVYDAGKDKWVWSE